MPVVAMILAAVAVVIDQFLKSLVVSQLKPVGTVTIIPGFLDFTYVSNNGAAFGILQNQLWLFIAITVVVSAAIILALFTYQNHTFFSYTASILIVAGGFGNMIDRIFHGYVVDYIHVLFFSYIFNFADCCVTVGCVLLVIHVLFFADRKGKRESVHHYRPRR